MRKQADTDKGISLTRDGFGQLSLMFSDGTQHAALTPVRAFPFNSPSEWISFCDENGREVFTLEDMAGLSADTRALLEEELARREFVPIIRCIHDVVELGGAAEWQVETDRGETRFKLVSEDHIRHLGSNGAILTDAHGIRFRILDIGGLDAHSRRILRRYL